MRGFLVLWLFVGLVIVWPLWRGWSGDVGEDGPDPPHRRAPSRSRPPN